ncbi:MAG: acyl carrier protein [Anaerolineae bacterium]|jgi:acyl carrier protein|nr:acyl carrier protein [Anaerolineae bacterium]
MTTETMLAELFREVFEDAALTITRATTADDINGWDSLFHVTLLMAVEDRFGIEFRQHEVAGLSNVGALIDLIDAKIATRR